MQALNFLEKNHVPFVPIETSLKDGTHNNSTHFDGFAKIQNLYITGHNNGVINFWDVSCPLLLPLVSLKQQASHFLKILSPYSFVMLCLAYL